MSVSVKYKKGAILTYTLHMFSPTEGFRINITGTKGRLEMNHFDYNATPYEEYTVYLDNKTIETIKCPKSKGMHNGGDERMLDMFFAGKPDPLGQCSDSYDGIKSAMIGIAARESIETGRRIELTEFLKSMK
jgi:predicted dehydrogenase